MLSVARYFSINPDHLSSSPKPSGYKMAEEFPVSWEDFEAGNLPRYGIAYRWTAVEDEPQEQYEGDIESHSMPDIETWLKPAAEKELLFEEGIEVIHIDHAFGSDPCLIEAADLNEDFPAIYDQALRAFASSSASTELFFQDQCDPLEMHCLASLHSWVAALKTTFLSWSGASKESELMFSILFTGKTLPGLDGISVDKMPSSEEDTKAWVEAGFLKLLVDEKLFLQEIEGKYKNMVEFYKEAYREYEEDVPDYGSKDYFEDWEDYARAHADAYIHSVYHDGDFESSRLVDDDVYEEGGDMGREGAERRDPFTSKKILEDLEKPEWIAEIGDEMELEELFSLHESEAYAAFCDPSRALMWARAGFEAEQAAAWARFCPDPEDAEAWLRQGFDCETALGWSDIVGGPASFTGWAEQGFAPQEALAWAASFSPEQASGYKAAGLDPEQAFELKSEVVSGADFSKLLSEQWQNFDPNQAASWIAVEQTPSAAALWIEASVTPEQSEAWISSGLEIERALELAKAFGGACFEGASAVNGIGLSASSFQEWLQVLDLPENFTANDPGDRVWSYSFPLVADWCAADISPSQASAWIEAGFGARDIELVKHCSMQGSPPEMFKDWREAMLQNDQITAFEVLRSVEAGFSCEEYLEWNKLDGLNGPSDWRECVDAGLATAKEYRQWSKWLHGDWRIWAEWKKAGFSPGRASWLQDNNEGPGLLDKLRTKRT